MLKTGVEIIQSSNVEKSVITFPSFEFLLDNQTPTPIAINSRVGEKITVVMKGLISGSIKYSLK